MYSFLFHLILCVFLFIWFDSYCIPFYFTSYTPFLFHLPAVHFVFPFFLCSHYLIFFLLPPLPAHLGPYYGLCFLTTSFQVFSSSSVGFFFALPFPSNSSVFHLLKVRGTQLIFIAHNRRLLISFSFASYVFFWFSLSSQLSYSYFFSSLEFARGTHSAFIFLPRVPSSPNFIL